MKHKHAEMKAEWESDTSRVVQAKSCLVDGAEWVDLSAASAPGWDDWCEYRFKPRELNEGELTFKGVSYET